MTGSYLVRVRSRADAGDSFAWELCNGDGQLVLQRSTKSFPTRVEALFDSAQNAALFALGNFADAAKNDVHLPREQQRALRGR
jgi:hypothetical protein